jgi:hypothetical protein
MRALTVSTVAAIVAGGWTPATRHSPSRLPTPSDFLGYPTCMIYASRADTRIRLRAARARSHCTALAKQLSRSGGRWSLKPRPLRHILSPICLLADPGARIELEVIDAAADAARGRRICARFARAGRLDLRAP